MISGRDFYSILTAIVPLYVAMMLAYGSVKWWKVFSPAQCSGISRFVAVFAVPFLSFHVISSNNPYTMNYRFIGADTLQKVIILVFLVLWCKLSSRGSLEWCITLFALTTLPNTLVVGLPLLEGMYGEKSGTLMVQIVGLQCIIWYTVLLFLFEYRGAKLLISEEFPETAGSIKSFKLDSDVISLDGKHPLETQSEVMEDGKLLVKVSKSSRISRSPEVSYRFSHRVDSLSRLPYFTDAEIYTLPPSRNESSRGSSFNELDSSYLLNDCMSGAMTQKLGSRRANYVNDGGDFKDVCMLVRRSSSAPPIPRDSYVFKGGPDVGMVAHAKDSGAHGGNEFSSRNGPSEHEPAGEPSTSVKLPSINELQSEDAVQGDSKLTTMPPVGVTTKLILITVWRKLVRNPNTYSSLLGLIWSLVSFRCHVQLPEIVAASITILSNTGLGIAMFSLGLFMALQPRIIACGKAKAGLGAVMRFLIGPTVMAASSAAVGLRGDLLRIAIVQAALPGGLVPFVFAQEYNVHADILSTAVMIGMVLTVPITLIYYIFLGLVH